MAHVRGRVVALGLAAAAGAWDAEFAVCLCDDLACVPDDAAAKNGLDSARVKRSIIPK